jgi:hypothetical protein
MSAKARKDKDSILADTKNLLKILLPAIQRMPKIERHDGVAQEMKVAALSLVSHFTTAFNCPEVREQYIHRMFGDYGKLLATFEIAIQYGLFFDSTKLAIATQLERIEEGIRKWHKALGHTTSSVRCVSKSDKEAGVRYKGAKGDAGSKSDSEQQ